MKFFKNLFTSKFELNISDQTGLDLKVKTHALLDELITEDVRKKLKGKKVDVIIPENFGTTVYRYANKDEQKHYDQNGYSKAIGNFAPSLDENASEFKIILEKSIFDDVQYYCTIHHEFTHVLDFTDYIKLYGNPMLMDFETRKQKYYFEFYLWAEFKAKKAGLQRLKQEREPNKDSLNTYLSLYTDMFIEEINGGLRGIEKLYCLVHFLARITVFDNGLITLIPQIYPKDFLKANFGENALVIHTELETIESFADFEREKDFLKYLFTG